MEEEVPSRAPPRRVPSHPGAKPKSKGGRGGGGGGSKGGGGDKAGVEFSLLSFLGDFVRSHTEDSLNLLPSTCQPGRNAKCVPPLQPGFLVQVIIIFSHVLIHAECRLLLFPEFRTFSFVHFVML